MDVPALRVLEARGHWGIKKGLANIQALLEGLGNPQRAYPAVLLAGTNGKGSTGAFLAHAIQACGLSVGWTTSPHLVSPTERIWIDGRILEVDELETLLRDVLVVEAAKGLQATYFELMVAAALLAFQRRGAALALVEVGMGGRWDSSNVLDPILTVLTSVGLDHTQHLGQTREAIAREKLCTARSGRPLVLGPGLDPAWVAPLLECDPVLCPADLVHADSMAWDHALVGGRRIALAGEHQLSNLSTALEVLAQLRTLGFELPPERVWEGIEAARWPGRLWKVPGLEDVWMDGAHNPDGAQALARHARACGFHPHLLFGAMGDKDLTRVAQALATLEPASLAFVGGTGERYARPEALAEVWGQKAPMLDIPAAAAALREPSAGPRLVTGSLYLLGDLLRELRISPHP